MGVDKDSVVLTTVVPIFGFIMAWMMYLSPWQAVAKMRREKCLGELNPFPFVFGMSNGLAWVGYGLAAGDKYVLLANYMGVILGAYYTLSAYGFASDRARQQLIGICLAVIVSCLVAGSVNVLAHMSRSNALLMWGVVATIILACYWCAPLATVARVFQTRSSASLHWPLCAANLMCSTLWTIYGFVVSQPFLWAPNGAGAILSIFQLGLIAIFPRTRPIELVRDGAQAGTQADVRVKLTLSLEGKGGRDGKEAARSFVRQWSDGQWQDVAPSPYREVSAAKAADGPAEARKRRLMTLSSASSLRQLLGGSKNGPASSDEEQGGT